MLGIGFTEMIVIGAIALVVIGPEKFPEVAKIFIRTVRDLRGYWEEAKSSINEELKPIKKEMNTLTAYDPKKILNEETSAAKRSWQNMNSEEGTSLNEAREKGYRDPSSHLQPGGDDPYADLQDEVAHTVPDDLSSEDVLQDRQEPQPQPYNKSTPEDQTVAASELGVGEDGFDAVDPGDLDDERA